MTEKAFAIRLARRSAELMRQGHARGAFARDARANVVGHANPRAVAWCAAGALACAHSEELTGIGNGAEGYSPAEADRLDRALITTRARMRQKAGGYDSWIGWSDASTTETVAGAFDQLAESLAAS